MKDYATENLRNIALVAHQGAGKTSLVEALMFNTGAINRMGEVTQGSTVSDFEEEEIRRGLSLSTSLIALEYSGHKINVLDTPGYTDFVGEVRNALRVVDAALVLVDASAGVEVGTELVWEYAEEFDVPRMVVVSKMDRDMARPDFVLNSLKTAFSGTNFVPLQLPLGERGVFPGVIDLVAMQALMGEEATPGEIPADVADAVEAARLAVVEAAAEGDDALLEKYFDEGTLSDEEIASGLQAGFRSGAYVPVFYTAATANVAIEPLLAAINTLTPSPAGRELVMAKGPAGEEEITATDAGPLVVSIFKTTADPYVGKLTYFSVVSGTLAADQRYYNVTRGEEERFGPLYAMRGKEQLAVDTMHAGDIGAVAKLSVSVTGDTLGDKGHQLEVPPLEFPAPVYAVAVSPKTQADSAKMGPILTRLCDEDQTLNWRQDAATKEAVLEGMGDTHVDVAVKRAAQLGVELETRVPRVPYRETVTKVHASQYRHKKQTGGAGQFAEVHLRVEPLERGDGFEYASEVFGGAISQSFIPSIEKGIKQVIEQGVIAGYPVVDVKAIVFDGKEHPVDSKDIAFQIAGREVFKEAFREAGPVLLEPIVTMRVIVPEANMGDVMGDLSTRRAQIQGSEIIGGKSVITALVPLAEVLRYSTELRSITQGRGVYTLEFDHYQNVPAHIAEEIIEQAKRDAEED